MRGRLGWKSTRAPTDPPSKHAADEDLVVDLEVDHLVDRDSLAGQNAVQLQINQGGAHQDKQTRTIRRRKRRGDSEACRKESGGGETKRGGEEKERRVTSCERTEESTRRGDKNIPVERRKKT